ncbi:MAG: GIY-YIG nuclease family protein [Symploca sp. SIO2E9]|nr:GIY-YIG nuclease family protein [Symploca sp. SIO2E9]
MINFPEFEGKFTLRKRHQLPSSPDIYFVLDNNSQLLYVGRAKNLRERWLGKSHHRYKQLARKGLDKITLGYIKVPFDELEQREKEYIEQFNPALNETKVKQFIPKKSPRFSELQRLLKLANKPLFPSVQWKIRNGETLLREPWDLVRGFVAGAYQEQQKLQVVVVCQQNMGNLLEKSCIHRTKRHFYIQEKPPKLYCFPPIFLFDARQTIFSFVEFQVLGEQLFEQMYPHLLDSQVVGVTIKKLVNPACLKSGIQNLPTQEDKLVQDYLLNICDNLQLLPDDFTLDDKLIW